MKLEEQKLHVTNTQVSVLNSAGKKRHETLNLSIEVRKGETSQTLWFIFRFFCCFGFFFGVLNIFSGVRSFGRYLCSWMLHEYIPNTCDPLICQLCIKWEIFLVLFSQ